MENSKLKTKEYFNSLTVLYYAMIASQIVFAVVVLFINEGKTSPSDFTELRFPFTVIGFTLALAAFYGNFYIFRKKLAEIQANTQLSEKMLQYRSACIIRWAILEVPSFFALVTYFLTGYIVLMVIVAAIIFYFLLVKPSAERAIAELELTDKEKLVLNNPDAYIS
jgi:hypothetical protein